jgi:hypothetical protein
VRRQSSKLSQASSILATRSDARAVQRLNAGSTCRRSLARFQPRAPGTRHAVSVRLRLLMDQDLRLRISGWWFEPTRSHDGKACSKGASCTCNAAVAGSIPVLSTTSPPRSGRQGDRGTARSHGKREGPVRPRVTARSFFRCRPMAGRRSLEPAIKVRPLAPEPRIARDGSLDGSGLGLLNPLAGFDSPASYRRHR